MDRTIIGMQEEFGFDNVKTIDKDICYQIGYYDTKDVKIDLLFCARKLTGSLRFSCLVNNNSTSIHIGNILNKKSLILIEKYQNKYGSLKDFEKNIYDRFCRFINLNIDIDKLYHLKFDVVWKNNKSLQSEIKDKLLEYQRSNTNLLEIILFVYLINDKSIYDGDKIIITFKDHIHYIGE